MNTSSGVRVSGTKHESEVRESAALVTNEPGRSGTQASPLHERSAQADVARATWVVILAGGEGERLREFTRLPNGEVRPKQFCHFRDQRSLLGATIDRACQLTRSDHIVVVVIEAHREWWRCEVKPLSPENVLVQPVGRGTAVAILCAFEHIRLHDESAEIVVMPSDHDFEDEGTLLRSVHGALRVMEEFPDDLVLLGIAPSCLDADYGLIEPGVGRRCDSRPIRAFHEKPSLTVAARLTHAGALWNSFIFTCTGPALAALYRSALPWVTSLYERHLAAGALADVFAEVPSCDFSRDVLQRHAHRLRLVEVPDCGWTDLGTPMRLAGWLGRHREAPFWREHRVPFLDGGGGWPDAPLAGGA